MINLFPCLLLQAKFESRQDCSEMTLTLNFASNVFTENLDYRQFVNVQTRSVKGAGVCACTNIVSHWKIASNEKSEKSKMNNIHPHFK